MSTPVVRRVSAADTHLFLLDLHYAQRIPSISYAYGLFYGPRVEGVCCFGSPAGAPVRSGLAGEEFASSVIELNRLCLLRNFRNDASRLVSGALKLLARDRGNSIVVSFADTSQGHFGYVYQACNFQYLGLSAKRTDWKVRGKEHLHGQTVADEFRGVANRAAAMREKYGDDFYLAPRSRKHRYVYVIGTKAFRKKATAALRYPVQSYPKPKVAA